MFYFDYERLKEHQEGQKVSVGSFCTSLPPMKKVKLILIAFVFFFCSLQLSA